MNIWLLLLQQPCFISHLLQKYKESGANIFRDQNAFIALSEAFRNMLKDPRLSPVYLAVDALDECAHGWSDLIRLISTTLTLSQKITETALDCWGIDSTRSTLASALQRRTD